MANIQEHLNTIKNSIYGKEVRGAIHDSIKQCYDDASVEHDNANMEVKLARGVYNTLNDRLEESDKIQKEFSSSLDNNNCELIKMKDRVVNENLTKYRFIATSFNQTDMKLVNMYSNDGSIWYVPNINGDFTSTTGNGTLRDPSILQWGSWYYICYTKIAWGTGNTIGYCRTKNFIDYEEFNDIAIGNYNKLWAPEFFRDYKTHKTYLVYSGSTNLQTDEFRGYLQEISFLSSGEMIKINEPIKLTGCCDINAIDFSIYQDTYKYYLVYKDETNKTMNFAQSENISGDYTLIKGNLYPKTEGAQIIKVPNGYRIYFDNYENDMMTYVETYDNFISFTGKVDLHYPNDFHGRHMFILDQAPTLQNDINLKCYGIFKNDRNPSIDNNKDVFVPMTTSVVVNDMFLDDDGAIIIPSDGLYNITASLSWVQNDNGFRTIAIEHHQKDIITDRVAIAINQVQAVQGNQTAQNVSTHCYCKCGDKIKLSVKQTSENSLNLVDWSHSVVMTCCRV